MRIAEHLVASTRGRVATLLRPEHAAWLWEHLRRVIPEAWSLVLMPDHLHLVGPPGLRDRLRRVLSGFTRRFGVRFEILEPEPANSLAIAGRMMRYGFFNPVRAGLVDDPWAWGWSSLRELVGAAHPEWMSLDELAAGFSMPPGALLERLTTTADYRGSVPSRAPLVAATLPAIRAAVATVLRKPDDSVVSTRLGRRLIVQTCFELGMSSSTRLAPHLGITPRAIRLLRTPRHPALDAVLLVLSSPRLQKVDESGRTRAVR